MTRKERLLSGVTKEMKGLEIGPSINPVVPKREGYQVETIDHADKQGLIEKYLTDRYNQDKIDQIEEVDYVWNGGSYLELTQKPNYYDYIIACHVIEHTVDMIGFLLDCEAMLKENGQLILAVPDKRYTFDLFKPITTTGQLIDAHELGNTFHTSGSVFDHFCHSVNGGIRLNNKETKETDSWGNYNVRADEMVCLKHDMDDVASVFNAAKDQKDYIDIHRFIFTPASFELLIHELSLLGMIHFSVDHISDVIGYEFIVKLKKDSSVEKLKKIDKSSEVSKRYRLLRRIKEEEGLSEISFEEHSKKEMKAKKITSDLGMHYSLDEFVLSGQELFVRGWAILEGFDCDKQKAYISFTEKENGKRHVFPLIRTLRLDVTERMQDSRFELSGILGFIPLSDEILSSCYLASDEVDIFVEDIEADTQILVGNNALSKYERLCEPKLKKIARKVLNKK